MGRRLSVAALVLSLAAAFAGGAKLGWDDRASLSAGRPEAATGQSFFRTGSLAASGLDSFATLGARSEPATEAAAAELAAVEPAIPPPESLEIEAPPPEPPEPPETP